MVMCINNGNWGRLTPGLTGSGIVLVMLWMGWKRKVYLIFWIALEKFELGKFREESLLLDKTFVWHFNRGWMDGWMWGRRASSQGWRHAIMGVNEWMSERGDILVLFSMGEGWMFYLLALWEKFYAGRSFSEWVAAWSGVRFCCRKIKRGVLALLLLLFYLCRVQCMSTNRQTDRQSPPVSGVVITVTNDVKSTSQWGNTYLAFKSLVGV